MFEVYEPLTSQNEEICPRRSHIVVLSATKTTTASNNYEGVATLTRRLDNIVAFRVRQFFIGITVGADDATTGPLYGLTSGKLCAQLASNPFQMGVSSGTVGQNVTAVSNLIGLANISSSHYTTNSGGGSLATCRELNPKKLYFDKPLTIEAFDWQIHPLAGNLINSIPMTPQIVLEFFPTCSCK